MCAVLADLDKKATLIPNELTMFSCINWKGGFKIDNYEIILSMFALLEKLQPFYM